MTSQGSDGGDDQQMQMMGGWKSAHAVGHRTCAHATQQRGSKNTCINYRRGISLLSADQ
jgi:hypothetical protein